LAHSEPVFIAFNKDVIAKRIWSGGDGFSGLTINRNMASGCMDGALCNSQQGYSPRVEGELFAVFL
jgi:hypothetical protein